MRPCRAASADNPQPVQVALFRVEVKTMVAKELRYSNYNMRLDLQRLNDALRDESRKRTAEELQPQLESLHQSQNATALVRVVEYKDVLHEQDCSQEITRPEEIKSETGKANWLTIAGVAVILLSLFMTGFFAHQSGYSIWLAPVWDGAFLIFGFGVVIGVFYDEKHPIRSTQVLKKILLVTTISFIPFFVMFGASWIAPPEWLLDYGLYFRVATLIVALLLCFIGSTLEALAFAFNWSRRMCRDYGDLAAHNARTEVALNQCNRTLGLPQVKGFSHGSALPGQPSPSVAIQKIKPMFIPPVVLFLTFLTGCTAPPPSVNTQDPGSIQKTATGSASRADPDLQPFTHPSSVTVITDATASTDPTKITHVIQAFLESLPQLAVQQHLVQVRACQFRDNGFHPEQRFIHDLPCYKEPPIVNTQSGYDRNLEVKALARKRHDEAVTKARDSYYSELDAALKDVKEAPFLPVPSGKKTCTALQGVLEHIAETSAENERRLILIVTDGEETCRDSLQPVRDPGSSVSVVILLVPKAGEPDPEIAFRTRKAALEKAAPWAVIRTCDTPKFPALFQEGFGKHPNQTVAEVATFPAHFQLVCATSTGSGVSQKGREITLSQVEADRCV
jgi:hypothetical protein